MDPSNHSQPWYVDPDQLKGALTAYPTLQAAIFPPPTTQLTPADSQDVTVYELLKVGVVWSCDMMHPLDVLSARHSVSSTLCISNLFCFFFFFGLILPFLLAWFAYLSVIGL